MSDWQVGDLALCVALSHPKYTGRTNRLALGKVYPVLHVRWSFGDEIWALTVPGARTNNKFGDWPAELFVKVTPRAEDEFDRETIRLLNREPTEATAYFTRLASALRRQTEEG